MKIGQDGPAPSKDNSIGTANKVPEVKEPVKTAEQLQKKPEPERKLIKFDTPEKKTQEPQMQEQTKKIPLEQKPTGTTADAAREELEQRRNMLQNMKDFDFQIKKNQEDITNLVEKVENLSKDLDDLVSLYEIVSEQMNPFVGLSKVTKKRLDALENFTKEVDAVKIRLGDLENSIEKTGLTTYKGSSQISAQPAPEQQNRKDTPTTPQPPPTTSVIPTVYLQTAERMTEREMDELLNKSLESLVMEQNIETMINDFFINLK